MAGSRDHLRYSPRGTAWLIGVGWLAVVAGLFALLPDRALSSTDVAFLAGMGVLGIWRWSWGGFHLLRAWFYTRLVFPMIRAGAEADPSVHGRHVAVVCLS